MTDQIEKLVEAYLASRQMDEDAAYLQRGRRFEVLTDAELDARWADAFRAWAARSDGLGTDFDDLGAEFSLRGRTLPTHLVEPEMQQVRDRIAAMKPEDLSSNAFSELDAFLTTDRSKL